MPIVRVTVGGSYGDDLKERLARYGITHGELARKLGKAPSELSRWVNSKYTPRMANIEKIEQAIVELRLEKRKAGKRKA